MNQLKYVLGTRDKKYENPRVSIQVTTPFIIYNPLNITADYHQYSILHITIGQLFYNNQIKQLHHISTASSGYILVKINLFFDLS